MRGPVSEGAAAASEPPRRGRWRTVQKVRQVRAHCSGRQRLLLSPRGLARREQLQRPQLRDGAARSGSNSSSGARVSSRTSRVAGPARGGGDRPRHPRTTKKGRETLRRLPGAAILRGAAARGEERTGASAAPSGAAASCAAWRRSYSRGGEPRERAAGTEVAPTMALWLDARAAAARQVAARPSVRCRAVAAAGSRAPQDDADDEDGDRIFLAVLPQGRPSVRDPSRPARAARRWWRSAPAPRKRRADHLHLQRDVGGASTRSRGARAAERAARRGAYKEARRCASGAPAREASVGG
eukprot:scaffold2961_cov263-Prasinococcus_capsulatus_cf.AAC.2